MHEQVRGRVRLLTMLLLVAFAFDPVLYFLPWFLATVAGVPLTASSLDRAREWWSRHQPAGPESNR